MTPGNAAEGVHAPSDRKELPDMKALRQAIPASCFEPSLATSMFYVIRDILLAGALFYASVQLTKLESSPLSVLLWLTYGLFQGFVFTGIWILGHECGHDAFSLHRRVNSIVGFILHSCLLVPFFSWKFSHSRHHRYANHMEKDTVFVPARKSEFRSGFLAKTFLSHAEDAPIVAVVLLLGHQLLGWPAYIIANAAAGTRSLVRQDRKQSFRQSHLDPWADLFSPREQPYVALSTVGLAAVLYVLWTLSRSVGLLNMCLIYGMPYLWMNHWLVAITFLHHTHPDVPHYEEGSWTFQNGALSTIDRDFGFVGKHLFHGIIEFHVVHHLFSRIPFYHAEEATEAIKPLLGDAYRRQTSSFLGDLWHTFNKCRYVEEHAKRPGCTSWVAVGHERKLL
ncbi:Fatty acid desaturase, type 1 [Moelleriella libera RCEF 2490]|uniref:Fatty acid desaturase, type 1 n=1 Tax=Moelleriella libera RCEF 2490 TaxID=1081109 RepID=A0A167WS24_9HYPO|nr:Fatty acid desaturase, type 1 [Moelleriella libera RCEF 2490]